jgi:uncharacterized repeat protein (TIGR01451 family)
MPSPPRTRSSAAHRVLGPCLLAAALWAVAAPAARAQEPEVQSAAVATGSGPLEVSIVVETLQVEQGADDREVRRWAPAGRLAAGDELYYTVRVHNPGKQPVIDVVVTKQLPFGVRYQKGSATGPACDVQFSTDGGATFAPPETRPTSSRKPARKATADYTHVRWTFRKPLAPNATALLRFRATFS